MVCWSDTEAFSVNCLRSLPAGVEWRILGVTFHKRALQGIEAFLRWKSVSCSLAVALETTVFPFVKQCIENKMAAECCYQLTFRSTLISIEHKVRVRVRVRLGLGLGLGLRLLLYIFKSNHSLSGNPWWCRVKIIHCRADAPRSNPIRAILIFFP